MGKIADEAAAELLTADRLLSLAKQTRTIAVDLAGERGTNVVHVTLQSIGRKRYDELVDKHPPADDATDGYPFDRSTFYPALIAASIANLEEPLTAEQAAQLFDEWPMPIVKQLIDAAMELSASPDIWSPGKGSAETASSPKSSRTASRSASRTAAS